MPLRNDKKIQAKHVRFSVLKLEKPPANWEKLVTLP